MPYKDLHQAPFTVSTITKLEIFEDYAEAWLPTFVMQKNISEVHIFDFFAGPGYDRNDVMGSPFRLLQIAQKFEQIILSAKTNIVFHFNEFEPSKKVQEKFTLLQKNIHEYLQNHPQLSQYADIRLYNKDAGALFFDLLPLMKQYPSLVYLDQNGVQFISDQFITELEKLSSVDFLHFVSSSYFWRFGDTDEFKKVLVLDMKELKKHRYVDIHRIVCEEVRKKLPANSRLKLYPFSIRKDKNIYGIIFGAKHLRAVDKFLDIAWRRNAINGEADFDIDGDNVPQPKYVQADLFAAPAPKRLTKVAAFKEEIKRLVLQKILSDNRAVLLHTYQSGHLPRHAAEAIKELKADGTIKYDGKTPGVNYENVFKSENIIKYTTNGTI